MSDAMIELTDDQDRIKRRNVRHEVAEFAIEMEMVLREHDEHKSGWDGMDIAELIYRITLEYNELKAEWDNRHAGYINTGGFVDGTAEERNIRFLATVQRMREEALDIANFCMFLCHNYPKSEIDNVCS